MNAQDATKKQPTVVGTWQMIEAWNIDDPKQPEQKTYPWGNPSSGYWVFDTSGHFGLMISTNPPLAIPADPFSGSPQPGWLTPTAPWQVPYQLLIDSFATVSPYAYFGTYTVTPDPKAPDEAGTLNLTVFADILRAYTGTVQERPFRYLGCDTIDVGVPDSYIRRLKRLT